MQVFCMHSEEELERRSWLSLYFTIQVVVVSIFLLSFLYFLNRKNANDFKEWDMKTVTISNYTVVYEIPDIIYKDFIFKYNSDNKGMKSSFSNNQIIEEEKSSKSFDNLNISEDSKTVSKMHKRAAENLNFIDTQMDPLASGDKGAGDKKSKRVAPLYSFKQYLLRYFEKTLSDSSDEAKIAHIHFAFKNSGFFKLMKNRGNQIKKVEDETILTLEEEIIEYLKKNPTSSLTPIEAYITFEQETGVLKALKYSRKSPAPKWRGTQVVFKPAEEPSNIEFGYKFQDGPLLFLKKLLVLVG